MGESNYQPALKKAARGRVLDWDDGMQVEATLVPEPRNRYDRNAVRVDVHGRTVGYIPRDLAGQYQPALLKLGSSAAWCTGRIVGGGDRYYGIFLSLASPRRAVFANSADGIFVYAAERMAAVTSLDHEVVGEFAGHDGDFPPRVATLAVAEGDGGKYAGESCIEVCVDGRRIGVLSRTMSERYLPTVRGAVDAGLRPGCETLMHRGDKGVKVQARMPRV